MEIMITNPTIRKQVHHLTACTVAPVLAAVIHQAAAQLVTDGAFSNPEAAEQELITAVASLLLLSDATPDEGETANITPRRLHRPRWCREWLSWRYQDAEAKALERAKAHLHWWQAYPETPYTQQTITQLQDEIAALEAGIKAAGVEVAIVDEPPALAND